MEKIEVYDETPGKILEHGNKLEPEERIKYYEDVIHELYVVRSAFDRDKYMGENTLRYILGKEIDKAKREIEMMGKNSDIIKINAQIPMSDLVRIFEPMKEVEIILKRTETKRLLRQFYTTKELDDMELSYNKKSNDILRNNRTTKSDKLIEYAEKFIEMNFHGRKDVLMRLEKFISKLQE